MLTSSCLLIVIAELYAGVKGDAEYAALQDFVSLFRVVPVSAEIAKAAGLYKRDFGKSHGRWSGRCHLSGYRRCRKRRVEDPQHQTLPHVEESQARLQEVVAAHLS